MIGTANNARAIAETYRSLAGMADAIDGACYRSMANWWLDRAEEEEAARFEGSSVGSAGSECNPVATANFRH